MSKEVNVNKMIITVPLLSNDLYEDLHYNIVYEIGSDGHIVNISKEKNNE